MYILEKLSELPSPWRDFLVEHDADPGLPMSVNLVLIGGFVFKFIYGLPRTTQDIDYCDAQPRFVGYDEIVGRRSDLGKKHGVHLHGAAHAELPINYKSRLTEILKGEFKHLRLFIPDTYDLVLSKLKRNSRKDQADVAFIFEKGRLDIAVLSRRYDEEVLKDSVNEAAFRSWTAMFQSLAIPSSSV